MGKINNAREAARAAARCAVSNSFVPGTKVLMADGSHKSIEDIRVGEQVLATDPITGESGPHTVVATIVGHGFKQLVDITIDTDGLAGDAVGTITATSGHPVWAVDEYRWIGAGELSSDAGVRVVGGQRVEIVARHVRLQRQLVFNFTVEGINTYHVVVVTTPILVHNSDCTRFDVDSNGVAIDRVNPNGRVGVPTLDGETLQGMGNRIWGRGNTTHLIGARSAVELRELASKVDAKSLQDFYYSAQLAGRVGCGASPRKTDTGDYRCLELVKLEVMPDWRTNRRKFALLDGQSIFLQTSIDNIASIEIVYWAGGIEVWIPYPGDYVVADSGRKEID